MTFPVIIFRSVNCTWYEFERLAHFTSDYPYKYIHMRAHIVYLRFFKMRLKFKNTLGTNITHNVSVADSQINVATKA